MEVVKWTCWDDDRYSNSRVSWDKGNEYEAAIIRKIREKGYKFSGPTHQEYEYGVPVLSDGTKYACSFRHWGGIMADALQMDPEDRYAYAVWAFMTPDGENEIRPQPEDWGATEAETEDYARL